MTNGYPIGPDTHVVPGPLISAIAQFERLPIPGGICTLDGTIVGMNTAAEALFGRPAAQVVGLKAWDIAPGADLIWEDVLAAARQRGTFAGEIAIATPSEPRQISYVLGLREEAGTTYAIVFALEVREEQAVRAEELRVEALGRLAGGIAHDFNNQLVSVLAEASAAREDSLLGEASRDALRRIEAAAQRMTQLTRQLLAYAGRGRFVAEIIDADELVRDSQELLSRLVRADAKLTVAPNAGRVAIEVDAALLKQVFVNLVANASEALGDHGTITITTRQVSRPDGATWWAFEITDNGSGMDGGTIARMFDPFFTKKQERHGLGLSAVHGTVRRLGGEISVDSKLGKGTTITIRLPVLVGVEPKRRRTTSKNPPLVSLEGIRVLVADDEPSVRTTVKRLLERRGAQVVIAADGDEAAQRLGDGKFELVLLDVMMPQQTGYQLLPLVREQQPGAKIMLMSGYSEVQRGVGGEDEPDAFLEKPFTAKVLDEAIDALFEKR